MRKFPYAKPAPASHGDTKNDLKRGRRPAYKPSTGDTKSASDLNRAKKFKKTPAYRKAVREAYHAASPARKQALLKGAPHSIEHRVIQKEHSTRTARRRELEKGKAQHDVVTDADLKTAARFNKPKKKGPNAFQFAAAHLPFHQEKVIAAAIHPGRSLGYSGKVLENAAREAVNIPGEIVPSTVHIAKPAYEHPTSPKAYLESGKRAGEAAISLPKEYVKAYGDKGLQGVSDTFKKRPLSTALTVAPIPRGPGMIAGGVARRAGKMPEAVVKELPGTAMKEVAPRSKSYFKAKRDSKKQGQVEDKHIETRVDEQVALMEDLSRRAQATTYRKTYRARKKVVGKKEAINEAALLAKKTQKKVRDEQKLAIAEGMGLLERPHYVAKPGGGAQLVKPASGKLELHKDFGKAVAAANRYNAHPSTKVAFTPYQVKGGYAVVPETMVQRLKQHEAKTEIGPVGAIAKGYNTLWRKNVLALHPTWYTGNVIEAALRSVVSGVGPTAYIRGYKALKELKEIDPKAYAEMTGHATKGGHLAMQARLPEETRHDVTGHTFLADTVRKVQKFRDNPYGPKQTADVWNNVTDFTMGTLSGKAESFFQTGMLGKELARNPLMDGHVLKTSKAAIADAAKGMRETHNQVALGRSVDRMYGKYGKFSPEMRRAIANYTPFIAWTMNSLNWLYRYLPKDHPVLTAAVASSQPYVDEWLKDKGLNAFVKGALPSFLRGSVPTKDGSARFPTRYTPFAFSAGFPDTLATSLLPQLEGAYNLAAHEINWKGQKVKNPDGTPLDPNQLSIAAALTLLEGITPGSQQIFGPSDRYAAQGARTPKEIVKLKSGGEILDAFTNPFVQVKSKEGKKKKAKSLFDTQETKQKSLYDTKTTKQKSLYDSP